MRGIWNSMCPSVWKHVATGSGECRFVCPLKCFIATEVVTWSLVGHFPVYLGEGKHSVTTSCVFLYIQQEKRWCKKEKKSEIPFPLISLLFNLSRQQPNDGWTCVSPCVLLFLLSSAVDCWSGLFLLRLPLVGSILDVKSSVCFPAQCQQGAFGGLLLHLCTL